MSRLYDAHNHLQDPRFPKDAAALIAEASAQGVVRMVVNGTCESDWEKVLALARQFPEVLPSFGCHPWHLAETNADWESRLMNYLDKLPSAIGEIGLDRWKYESTISTQIEVFSRSMRLAAERNLPVSIHCLEAWGCLHDLLRSLPLPRRGFLLHSYGGPREMVKPLAKLGAYFSFPGYFAHDRKARHRVTFLDVPKERLLIETDAPDQLPPQELQSFPLRDPIKGDVLNHPANLKGIYLYASQMLGLELGELERLVERNFLALFQGL